MLLKQLHFIEYGACGLYVFMFLVFIFVAKLFVIFATELILFLPWV